MQFNEINAQMTSKEVGWLSQGLPLHNSITISKLWGRLLSYMPKCWPTNPEFHEPHWKSNSILHHNCIDFSCRFIWMHFIPYSSIQPNDSTMRLVQPNKATTQWGNNERSNFKVQQLQQVLPNPPSGTQEFIVTLFMGYNKLGGKSMHLGPIVSWGGEHVVARVFT